MDRFMSYQLAVHPLEGQLRIPCFIAVICFATPSHEEGQGETEQAGNKQCSEEDEGVRGVGHMCFPHILTVPPPPPPTRPSRVQSAAPAAPLAAERESGMDQFDGIWR